VSEVDKAKQDRLAAAGWRSGDAADFLGLTEEEEASPQTLVGLHMCQYGVTCDNRVTGSEDREHDQDRHH
jgi:hypothetical protein